ncbi:MAG: IS66 family insertion sequence element accessory protein TnpB, partial [Thermomonas sp.]
SPAVKIFLCAQATDMRRSFDKLAEMTRELLGQDPLSGHLFVFFNKPRDRVKILFWDRSGYCLYYKRLEEGAFRLPKLDKGGAQLNAAELALILEGIELAGSRRQKRFSLSR